MHKLATGKIEWVELQLFSCNVHLDKVEINIIQIVKNYDCYDTFWYNLVGNENNSFCKLLNLSYVVYYNVFIVLNIFRRKYTLLIVNMQQL